MKTLKPVQPSPEYYDLLEKEILRVLKKFYQDILGSDKKVIKNAANPIGDALLSGRVYYMDGYFYGKFDSKITRALKKAGAIWDKRRKAFKLLESKMSGELLSAVSQGVAANKAKFEALIARAEAVKVSAVDVGPTYQKIIDSTSSQVDDTVKEISTVQMQLTEDQTAAIKDKYLETTELSIKGWTQKKTEDLRAMMYERYQAGDRYESVIKSIADDYSTSVTHAKFLARQETHLLVAQVKQEKYAGVGIDSYIWKTLNKPVGNKPGNVRPRHGELDGQEIRYDSPPIVDFKTGRTAHAGADFGCRCIQLPVWDDA